MKCGTILRNGGLAAWLLPVAISGCGTEQRYETMENSSNKVLEDDSDFFLNQSEKREQIPDIPRRRLSQREEIYKNSNMKLGLKTSFAGAEYETQTTIEFISKYFVISWMFAEGEEEAFAKDGKEFYLNNRLDRPFQAICRVGAYLETSDELAGRISIFGNGAGTAKGLRVATEVIQTSAPFAVDIGGSWKDVIAKCREYSKSVKPGLDRDFEALATSMAYHNPQNECVTDSHCKDSYDELLPGVKQWAVARCVQQRETGNRFCRLRSKQGGSCPVFDANTGERLTGGRFEYRCDKGLTCQVTEEGGWFKDWVQIVRKTKAECR